MNKAIHIKWVLLPLMVCLMAACNTSLISSTKKHTCTQVSVLRANGGQGVLWLPVQESMGEATIRILSDNQQLEVIHVRLAKDSIDYFVPYEMNRFWGRDLLFEIRTWLPDSVRRDRMVCWDAITTGAADLYPVEEDSYRCLYHHTPLRGWMNDPNGMFYDAATGLWHLYYQHNPYGAMWGNMHWAHSISRDLIHWERQPMALRPTAIGTIFSGSAVMDTANTAGLGKDAVVAIYTADGESQKQAIAYSTDGGNTFTHYADNPILTDTIADFRDPKVFWDSQASCWTMVLACQQEMRFYQSEDLKNWHYVSRFGEGFGNHDGVWECPDLIELHDATRGESLWVLLCNINPGGPFGGSATQYFVGRWDGTTFTCIDGSQEEKWLDYGKDHYATVTWYNAPAGRVVALGWMSNWQYANKVPTRQFRSQNTIARDLSLYIDDKGEYRVRVVPSQENELLRSEVTTEPTEACVIDVTLPRGKQNAAITLSNDKGEKVVMTYHFGTETFTMDRRHAGISKFSKDFASVTKVPLFRSRDTYHLTLYIDRCSIEAFDADGDWVMTNLVFPTESYNHLDIQGGEATIYSIAY